MKIQTIPSPLALGLFLAAHSPANAVDFASQVRPIFEARCFECHGPQRQRSSFRLDLREAAMRGGSGGPAIVPGKADQSPLVARISAPHGHEHRMPPEGPPLSPAQIDAISRWIDAGAPWPDELAGSDTRLSHWAWQPLSEAGHELVAGTPGHPVDALVGRSLREAGLTMSPEADRRTLIRRLTFALHGLPPSPEAVEAFVADPDPMAYENLVDALLASPHFGERFARHWLDIAHYADTHGFERDQRRDSAWRYRDYVIGSFNQDKPYDLFLQEQIAGDVLWPDRPEAVIATGFLAAGPWDYVGQVETKSDELRRAARALDLDDMVTQVMAATMALTVNCARCHDHKLDPISQDEYYQLWAVFAGVKRGDRPVSEEAQQEFASRRSALVERAAQLDLEIGRIGREGLDLSDIVGGGDGTGTGVRRQGIDPRDASPQTEDQARLDGADSNRFAVSTDPFVDGVFIPDGRDEQAPIPVSSTGLTITGLPETSAEAWDLIRNGPVASQHSTVAGGVDFAKAGRSLLGLHANAGITFDLDAFRGAIGSCTLRFTAQLAYFGREGGTRADVWVFLDGQKEQEFLGLTRADGPQDIALDLPETARFLTLISGDGGDGISHDQIGFGDPLIRPHPPVEPPAAVQQQLARLREDREAVSAELSNLVPPPTVYAVLPQPAPPMIRLLRRGEPEHPDGPPLAPAALSLLPMLDPDLGDLTTDQGQRRAALANWLTHPQNPMAHRVIVNRLWHWLFGSGIVATPSDFGLGGDLPSHPELLDWLAAELRREGGSIKAVLRRILTSATYRQDSRYLADAPGIAVDAGNRLLWRQNPRRIEAEAVRDAVLAVGGTLVLDRGGPGFEDFTYEEAYAPVYTHITADRPELWRRSIYRYVVRSTPSRFMTTLDCPDPANLAPVRMTTTTPLQSLALYNNEFMLQQARHFERRLVAGGEDPVGQAFALAFARAPSEEERAMSQALIREEGLFAFCRAILNANEFVYVD